MNLGIKGKTAIVCGASQGLGRACAEMFAHEGVNLLLFSSNFDRIFSTARSISENFGIDVVPVASDISLPDSPEKIVSEAVKRFGSVDILINNPGEYPPGNSEEMYDQKWEKSLNLTFMSAIRMTRAVLPQMISRGWGRIINLTSIPYKQPIQDFILSNSLRNAVEGMAKTLSWEVASQGILINTVSVGNFDTKRLRSILKNHAISSGITEKEAQSELESTIPVGRIGRPEELAWFVVFLASEKASYISGSTFQVDGGMFNGYM